MLGLPLMGNAQKFVLPEGQHSEKIKFELINNLIIIPLELNGTELSFVLDSGVSNPILFNLSDQDSVTLKDVSRIHIRGLGGSEPIEALSSRGNGIRLKQLWNPSSKVFVVLDKDLNFSTSIGKPVHGIIGYDLFKDYIVDVNYSSKTIRFYDPDHFNSRKLKKYETFPLQIENKKAYLEGHVGLHYEDEKAVKLLLDTGSSDAVWLFRDTISGLGLPAVYYEDFLGKGLAGDIFGKRTKVNSFRIGPFLFEDAKAAYPDMDSFNSVKNLGDRNGSIGGEILKRFQVVFDYPNGRISLKKNGNFNDPFPYNMSGIELQHNGMRYVAEQIADPNGVVYKDEESFGNVQILLEQQTRLSLVPEIVVSAIRAGSPAAKAGLQEGDVILAVNGKRVHRYKLQEIMHMLNEREGKRVRVLIERFNQDLLFTFVLKDLFK